MALRHVEDGRMAAVMHRTAVVAVYSARRKTFIADCEDVAIRLRINNRNRSESPVRAALLPLEKSRYVESRRKPFPTTRLLIKRRARGEARLEVDTEKESSTILAGANV